MHLLDVSKLTPMTPPMTQNSGIPALCRNGCNNPIVNTAAVKICCRIVRTKRYHEEEPSQNNQSSFLMNEDLPPLKQTVTVESACTKKRDFSWIFLVILSGGFLKNPREK
jgi:hypothetical protein